MFSVLLSFLVIWAGSVGLGYVWLTRSRKRQAARIQARLSGKDAVKAKMGNVSLFEQEHQDETAFRAFLVRLKLHAPIQALIDQSGSNITPQTLILWTGALLFCGAAIAATLLPDRLILVAVPVSAASGSIPILWLMSKRHARVKAFESAFPEVLEFIARAMRAGHSFSVALEMIPAEFTGVVASEFKRTIEEHKLGLNLDVALTNLGDRMPFLDLQFFVSAVLLQKRTGGNLAEVLDKLAYLIRERFKLRGRISALSAHGRMTGVALSCIPIAVAVLLGMANPAYILFFLTDETGQLMLGSAVGLQVAGYLLIRRIVRIEA